MAEVLVTRVKDPPMVVQTWPSGYWCAGLRKTVSIIAFEQPGVEVAAYLQAKVVVDGYVGMVAELDELVVLAPPYAGGGAPYPA